MRFSSNPFIVLAVSFAFSSVGLSDTIYVPKDYPTIQAAIDAASNGDSVFVAKGTYVENIDFKGKAITVKSEQGPDVTTIDGGNPVNPDYGSVVMFQNGEDLDSVLEGFTITNGSGTYQPYWKSYYGGGIYCFGSFPKISDNIITLNSTKNAGGGIYCDCTLPAPLNEYSPEISNNIIVFNYTEGGGGGIYCDGSSPDIFNNIIRWNNVSFGFGGGIACCLDASPTITKNDITGNTAYSDGGGICCYNSSPTIINNTVSMNEAGGCGGGFCFSNNSSPTVTNTTVIGNTAVSCGGGIHCAYNSFPAIANSILWDNDAPMGKEIYIGTYSNPSTLTISYSDVKGGKNEVYVESGNNLNWGPGMIDADPLLADPVNGDFHLTWISPCINRGTNDDSPTVDFDGDSRPCMGTTDIGADEFTGIHPLEADIFNLPESIGGMVNFYLKGQTENAGRNYIMLGSVTGTASGNMLPGGIVIMPIHWDIFTDFVLDNLNTTYFINFLGALDATGAGFAIFNTNGTMPSGTAGITISFAYALNKPWDFVSNPVNVEIVP